MSSVLRRRRAKHVSGSPEAPEEGPVEKTGQLYRIPRIREPGTPWKAWSRECVTWPRYDHGVYSVKNKSGDSMLDLTKEEAESLVLIVLRVEKKVEKYGSAHQINYTKVGLSRAYFVKQLVCDKTLPTAKARAALKFLMSNNRYYNVFYKMHERLLQSEASLNISSYDLFIVHHGIECAMYPVLYPTTDFTDTGILQHYQDQHGDNTNRVCSIGTSWTRKVLSSVRVYSEQVDLPFFLYEKHLASKFFHAQVRAQRMGVL